MSGEIITVAEMRAVDQASVRAGVASRTLMEKAGAAVADAIVARYAPQPTAVLCGPGNNGGDGWVAARKLLERGWPVWVEAVAPLDALKGDAADAAKLWTGKTLTLGAALPSADLFVDALFGAGLTRPLEGEAARVALALPPERVVAVDLPSGINGDTGAPLGDAHFVADLTITFVRKKPAHVLMPARGFCGEIVVADIGAPEGAVSAQAISLWENAPALWQLPWPDADTHKYERGHVVVASGGRARTGAARLAARSALRVGAGVVAVLSPSDALDENAAHLTAIMVREARDDAAYAEMTRAAACALIGPGFGLTDAHYKMLRAALEQKSRCPMVIDADAITMLAPISDGFDPRDVLTPHVGEFRRAFPGVLSASQNRIDAARAASAYAGCIVVLKGPDTVIAAPDGRAAVNVRTTPFLATAGAGDVLAGIVAGLIGQGMASFEAACAGVWLHSVTANQYGPGLIAEDICENLPVILNELAPPVYRRGLGQP